MASLAQGIVGGDMAWPLVIAGILMGVAMIMFKVRSPMLVAIGMYLPIATTSAIFVGGMVRWVTDRLRERRRSTRPRRRAWKTSACWSRQRLIAGEALAGLVKATFDFRNKTLPAIFAHPSYWNFCDADNRLGADRHTPGKCRRSQRARTTSSHDVTYQ